MKKDMFPLLALGLLFGCGGNNPAEESREAWLSGDTVFVSASSPLLSKISVSRLESEPYAASFSTSGVVKAIPSNYAEVASPFAGRIVRSLVRIGQRVEKGAPLFEISSADFSDAVKSLSQAREQMELARKTLARERDLLANRVGAVKDVEEAEAAFEGARDEYDHAVAALRVYDIDPARCAVGQPLTVRAPIGGEVLRNDLVVGEYLREDADPRIAVADLRKVWVAANVMENEVRLLGDIDSVSIELVSQPGRRFAGELCYTGGLLDPQTRSVEVIVACDNAGREMMPNMFATVHLTSRGGEAVLVPKTAVLQRDEARYVLVKAGERAFRKVDVQVASADSGRVVVLGGVDVGQEVVVSGAFYLVDVK